MASFGEFFKLMREKRGLTLRRFCQDNGLDAGNISKMERGLLPPPHSREKLEQYAAALCLETGSDDWLSFFDCAAASSGKIPLDVMSNADLVAKLPLVFRTLRGQKVQEDKLDDLIERIRKA